MTTTTALDLTDYLVIVEDESGAHEPIGIYDAAEIAQAIAADELRRADNPDTATLCPFQYTVWTRGIDGYVVVDTIPAYAEVGA